MEPASKLDPLEVRLELDRILSSKSFEKAKRSQRFLSYLVDISLADRSLSTKEYDIAVEVFERKPNYDPSVDATVRVEAGRLRSRLRDYYLTEGQEDRVVIEIPKGGYVAVFVRKDGYLHPKEATTASLPVPLPDSIESVSVITPDKQQSHRQTIISAAITIAILVLAAAGWEQSHRRMLPTRLPIHSMAILPLRNLSGTHDKDYLAEGMTDELTTQLARIPQLRVVSNESSAHEEEVHRDLKQIARELDVDAVVTGSVLHDGKRVRINVTLTDARNARQLWADSLEGDPDNLIALQDSVAQEISTHARLALQPGTEEREVTSKRPSSDAYDAYLRGRYFLHNRDVVNAERYFRQAIDSDPGYASAYAGLAEALESEITIATSPRKNASSEALAAAHKALELDPANGPAHTALGTIEFTDTWDWQHAEQDLIQGIRLSPEDSFPRTMHGLYLIAANQPELALIEMKHAEMLDPLSFFVSRNVGSSLYFVGKYDESILQLDRAKELQPQASALVNNWKSWVYEAKGMQNDAVKFGLAALEGDRPDLNLTPLREAYRTGGWKAYWRSRLKTEDAGPVNACVAYRKGVDYLEMGDFDRSINELQRAIKDHCFWTLNIGIDPRFAPLRTDARFAKLVAQTKPALLSQP